MGSMFSGIKPSKRDTVSILFHSYELSSQKIIKQKGSCEGPKKGEEK